MTAQELIAAGERLYGPRWRLDLCRTLKVNVATLRRWTSGRINVPGPVDLAVSLMLKAKTRESL
jgi:hypothetical protein